MTQRQSPLGPGKPLAKDPMKGFQGVCAAALSMESICVLLVLTVIARVNPEANFVTWKIVYVSVLGVWMFLHAFLQRYSWSMPVNMLLQGLTLVGFVVHPTLGVVGLVFALVWGYLLYLQKQMRERIAGGFLPAQHQ